MGLQKSWTQLSKHAGKNSQGHNKYDAIQFEQNTLKTSQSSSYFLLFLWLIFASCNILCVQYTDELMCGSG